MSGTYAYKVRDRKGKLRTGTLDGPDAQAVATRLREMGLTPINVAKQGVGLKTEIVLRPGHVELKDLAVFFRQFATMINAGLPIIRCISALGEQTTATELAKVLKAIRLEIEQGASLTSAMGRHPKTFSPLMVAMVRTGETTGLLGDVMAQLATEIEKEVTLRGKVRSAMSYPIAVIAIVVLILIAMLLVVVPQFERIYGELGADLPFPTLVLLAMSKLFQAIWWLLFLSAIGGAVAFRRWIATSAGRFAFDALKFRLPVVGELFRKVALARFANTLSMLLRAGVGVLPALEVVRGTVNNAVVSGAIDRVRQRVREGESVSAQLAREEVFPPMVVQMMTVGEESGAVDTMMDKVAIFLSEEVSASVDSLTSILEPLLIVVVGGVVGAAVVALYLPMFNVINLLK